MRGTAPERFWAKVAPAAADACWLWTATPNHDGYGRFVDETGRRVMAHRWAYEYLRAPIPDGLTIDHLCRVRACVNPWHLEPVPHAENCHRTRWTHCAKGHPLTADNLDTYDRRGYRRCKTCRRAKNAEWTRRWRTERATVATCKPA